ncbi:hypothetical protein LOD99_11990 [Oopsacas minuta]|uniref:Uncharacterized protein n=1 Tax=Oopsacas minuta TaxID=111878 RepID=A0AAV7JH64_9METZ|nr:hypothetical protein LOD99_11990 [Oopsacas minuta]
MATHVAPIPELPQHSAFLGGNYLRTEGHKQWPHCLSPQSGSMDLGPCAIQKPYPQISLLNVKLNCLEGSFLLQSFDTFFVPSPPFLVPSSPLHRLFTRPSLILH